MLQLHNMILCVCIAEKFHDICTLLFVKPSCLAVNFNNVSILSYF